MSSIVAVPEGRSSRCGLIPRVYRRSPDLAGSCPVASRRRGPVRVRLRLRAKSSPAPPTTITSRTPRPTSAGPLPVSAVGSDGGCVPAVDAAPGGGAVGAGEAAGGIDEVDCAAVDRAAADGLALGGWLAPSVAAGRCRCGRGCGRRQRSGRSSVPPSGTAMFVGAAAVERRSGRRGTCRGWSRRRARWRRRRSRCPRRARSRRDRRSRPRGRSRFRCVGVGFGVGRGGFRRRPGGGFRRRPGRRIRTDDRDDARHRRMDLAVVREPSRLAERGRVRVADLEDRAAAESAAVRRDRMRLRPRVAPVGPGHAVADLDRDAAAAERPSRWCRCS